MVKQEESGCQRGVVSHRQPSGILYSRGRAVSPTSVRDFPVEVTRHLLSGDCLDLGVWRVAFGLSSLVVMPFFLRGILVVFWVFPEARVRMW